MAKILVLDDDESVLAMLLRWLSDAGYEAGGAGDGERGLRLLETEPYDLVVTDILMPGKEGLETIPAIRRKRKDLPIIAMSGGGSCGPQLYLEMALKLGAVYAFQKPFDREPFLKVVRGCLSGIKPGAGQPDAPSDL